MMNRLEKYWMRMMNPAIVCGSKEAVSEKIQFTVTTSNQSTAVLDVVLKVKGIPVRGGILFKGLFVFLGALFIIGVALFFGITCFYKRRERYLRKIYQNIKQKHEEPTSAITSV